MTQEYAAEQLETSLRTIQNFEAGERDPRLRVAFAMADLYGCNIEEFRAEARQKKEEEATV